MGKATYTQHYSNFIGVDSSSDPRAVARNRLAYAINMWRDYESEQGAAVETFPGFRRVAKSLGLDIVDGEESGAVGAVHGLYHFRSRKGGDYLVVHAGTRLYAFEENALASGDYEEIAKRSAIISTGVADNDSTGFIYNNNLYILDGSHYLTVTAVDSEGTTIKASAVDAYVPTTYYNGNVYEQRNMLTNTAVQIETGEGEENRDYDDQVSIYSYSWKRGSQPDGKYVYSTTMLTKGFSPGLSGTIVGNYIFVDEAYDEEGSIAYTFGVDWGAFRNNQDVRFVSVSNEYKNEDGKYASRLTLLKIDNYAFKNCVNLERVFLSNNSYSIDEVLEISNPYGIIIEADAFANCPKLKEVILSVEENRYFIEEGAIPEGVTVTRTGSVENPFKSTYEKHSVFKIKYPIYEPAVRVNKVTVDEDTDVPYYIIERHTVELNGEEVEVIKNLYFRPEDIQDENGNPRKLKIELELHPSHFRTLENMKSFAEDNSDYKKTSIKAINGCTKAAVFDGRVFLTGNGELPNTVFYSHRNLTGANDPAYFGVYNYFNDGTGNTPNVDILSTPSMLMVMKRDTVQDGSVYYHVGMDNTDSGSADLLPRIYPSTQGAAGLGSAGGGKPSRLSCNFLDDPVFLSKRGLEAVGKETVNLERTITHRSSNVDRMLIREDLSRATMAEWKRYLVICCRGHVYLADSRYMVQHPDGSYQYEWYYLEGLGTYDSYAPRWAYWLDFYPYIELEGSESVSLDNFLTLDGERVGDVYLLHESGELEDGATVMVAPAVHPEDDAHVVDLYYVESDGVKYLVGINGDEKVGVGNFYPATKIVTLGDRLIFGTDHGDICIINTDKRGEAVDGRAVEYDRIDRSYYTFNGVAYRSGCAVRLDDCDAKALKATVCGTTSARFKMMPGSHCKVNISLDGRNWQTLGEAYSSRFDFADIDFGNFSFAENENNVVVFPEMTRGWINKQYYFYSDRYQAPFGLYELSYVYYISGKIRY